MEKSAQGRAELKRLDAERSRKEREAATASARELGKGSTPEAQRAREYVARQQPEPESLPTRAAKGVGGFLGGAAVGAANVAPSIIDLFAGAANALPGRPAGTLQDYTPYMITINRALLPDDVRYQIG